MKLYTIFLTFSNFLYPKIFSNTLKNIKNTLKLKKAKMIPKITFSKKIFLLTSLQ